MPASNVEENTPVVEARDGRRVLGRIGVLIAGALLGLLVAPNQSNAGKLDPCPIPGCVDQLGPTCGICQTVNGSFAVYYP